MPRSSIVALLWAALVLSALYEVSADARAHQAHEVEAASASSTTQTKPVLRTRAKLFNWASPTAAPTWTAPTAAPTWTAPTVATAPTVPIEAVPLTGAFSLAGFGGSTLFSGSGVTPAGLSFSLSGNVAPTDLSFSAIFSTPVPFSAAPFVPTAAPTVPVIPLTPGVDTFSQAGLSTQVLSTPAGFSTQAFSFDYSTSQPAVAFSTAAFSAFGLSSSSSVNIGGIGGGGVFIGSPNPSSAPTPAATLPFCDELPDYYLGLADCEEPTARPTSNPVWIGGPSPAPSTKEGPTKEAPTKDGPSWRPTGRPVWTGKPTCAPTPKGGPTTKETPTKDRPTKEGPTKEGPSPSPSTKHTHTHTHTHPPHTLQPYTQEGPTKDGPT
mmetsp:Transcript_26407/g.59708  ORF Transcript_26407/g.59708 Transcript_26407/m.59708 type:complete len:380 (+) Transcript_26407:316-1455(+)